MPRKKNEFVLDCSVMMAFLLREEEKEVHGKIEKIIKSGSVHVPTIWTYEVTNVLSISERKGRISEADIQMYGSIISAFSVSIDESSTTKAFTNTLNLSREYKLTTYDAAYLELSMRKGAVLASFDKALNQAAKKAGIQITFG